MDLSSKSFPSPKGNGEPTPPDPHAGLHDPRQYMMPYPPGPYNTSTQKHQYPDPTYNPYFYQQVPPHELSPYSQALYPQPSPLFMHNGYQNAAQSLPNFFESQYNYGANMLDGMVQSGRCPKAARPPRCMDEKRERREKKKDKDNCTKKQDPGCSSDRSSKSKKKGDSGTLQELLYSTLQQEVDALDVLRKQIAQFAILTKNAEKFCDMGKVNQECANQGVLNDPPPTLGPQPPPARHTLPTAPAAMAQYPRYRPPPPPAHMNSLRPPFPPRPPYPLPPRPGKNPMEIAVECMHDVEKRLKMCEKVVANKIELYEQHLRKEGIPIQACQREGPQDIQEMAMKTLKDIEERLKTTEKRMDEQGIGRNRPGVER